MKFQKNLRELPRKFQGISLVIAVEMLKKLQKLPKTNKGISKRTLRRLLGWTDKVFADKIKKNSKNPLDGIPRKYKWDNQWNFLINCRKNVRRSLECCRTTHKINCRKNPQRNCSKNTYNKKMKKYFYKEFLEKFLKKSVKNCWKKISKHSQTHSWRYCQLLNSRRNCRMY